MPAIDVKLMTLRASLEHQLEEAKAGAAEARAELAIFNLPKAEQDLAWPEGPRRSSGCRRRSRRTRAASRTRSCCCRASTAGPSRSGCRSELDDAGRTGDHGRMEPTTPPKSSIEALLEAALKERRALSEGGCYDSEDFCDGFERGLEKALRIVRGEARE